MKKSLGIPAILMITFLLSCNTGKIYEEHKTNFPKFRWDKSNIVEFTPEVTDTENNYQLIVAIRHIFGFNLSDLKIKVEIIAPSGKETTADYTLSFYNQENDLLSKCIGDFCDFEQVIENDFTFNETGTYQINIHHQMDQNPIPNIMEVGLIIENDE